jgi:hypothetical protein
MGDRMLPTGVNFPLSAFRKSPRRLGIRLTESPNGFNQSRHLRAALNLRDNRQSVHPTDSKPPADWEFVRLIRRKDSTCRAICGPL